MAKRFKAVIESAGRGGAYVTVPFDVEATFGSKRPKIKATFDGEPYRGTLVRMGTPDHILPILKEIRERIEKGPGDEVRVTIELDTEPREVLVPKDFAEAMNARPDVREYFDQLSFTNRKEYVRWIEGAKKAETRASRIERATTMLDDGKRSP